MPQTDTGCMEGYSEGECVHLACKYCPIITTAVSVLHCKYGALTLLIIILYIDAR